MYISALSYGLIVRFELNRRIKFKVSKEILKMADFQGFRGESIGVFTLKNSKDHGLFYPEIKWGFC